MIAQQLARRQSAVLMLHQQLASALKLFDNHVHHCLRIAFSTVFQECVTCDSLQYTQTIVAILFVRISSGFPEGHYDENKTQK